MTMNPDLCDYLVSPGVAFSSVLNTHGGKQRNLTVFSEEQVGRDTFNFFFPFVNRSGTEESKMSIIVAYDLRFFCVSEQDRFQMGMRLRCWRIWESHETK